ncbi:PP2C family protein-serine/threonine phosphatase [Sphingomonas sp. ac-8]|uniref:PP2C family protein-serine/threonine phosphatase n=1 Tax=Sphingomonas sp. ac-8 TaxID=3242977 RepID=UPI003A7FCA79
MTGGWRIHAVAATHPGLVRRINEDRYCTRDDVGLWAVADGMGGHAHGDWASNAVVQALESVLVPLDFRAATQTVADAVHSANRRVFGEAQRRGQQMGSTVVSLLVQDGCFAALWVGDSRAYVLRDGDLHPLTRDHSQVQEMVDRGLITEAEAHNHPRGHVLARAIGVGARLAVDVVTDEVAAGDLFLLCSDGLTGMLDNAAIARILAEPYPQAALDALIAGALAGGAPDNVTAILVAVQEGTQRAPLSMGSAL